MNAPIPLSDWRRIYDAVPNCRIVPWRLDGGKKRPLTTHGISDSTRDPDTIVDWATRWPDAFAGAMLIGIGCLDCDVADGAVPGADTARSLAPGAPESESMNGGLHLWVSTDARSELKCNRPASRMRQGVEWRGPETGFIAITESDLQALTLDLPVASNELINLVAGATPSGEVTGPDAKPPAEQTRDRGAVRLVRAAVEAFRTAGEGSREPALNDLAFTCGGLHGAGRMPDDLLAEAMAGAEKAAVENGAGAKYGDGWLDEKFRRGLADGARRPLPLQHEAREFASEKRGPSQRQLADNAWTQESRPVLQGTPLEQPVNALAGLGVELRRNLRSMGMEWRRAGSDDQWEWKAVEDDLMAQWRAQTAQRWVHPRPANRMLPPRPAHIGREVWDDGCSAHCWEHRCDPALEWMESCVDRPDAPEIEDLIDAVWSVTDEHAGQWVRAVSRVLLIGAAYLTVHPGEKMDLMPVLIGPQGTLKSTFFRALLPPQGAARGWHVDGVSADVPLERAWERVRSAMLAEMSEMRGRDRAEVGQLKALLTQQSATIRLPYGRHPVTIPGRHVWVGTSNDPITLPHDATGGRRFCPVQIEKPRMTHGELLAWCATWRESLFAQALARVQAGERPVLTEAETDLQHGHVEQHMLGGSDIVDELTKAVAADIDQDAEAGAGGVALRSALLRAAGGDEKVVNLNSNRVAAQLRAEGYQSKRSRWGEKTKSIRWFRGQGSGVGRGSPREVVATNVVRTKPSKHVLTTTMVETGTMGNGVPTPDPCPPDGFDEAMAELTCVRCRAVTLPSPSGLCVACERQGHG